MDRDKKARAVVRTAFTRLHDKVVADLASEDSDAREIQANIILLERKVIELRERDKTMFDDLLDAEAEAGALEQEAFAADEYQRKYERLQIDVLNVLKPVDAGIHLIDDANSVHSFSQGARRKFKLPKIELKKFGGDIKEWLHFWSQFRKIDEDNELADEDKFQYLIQATIEGSRARDLVSSFPPTGENYRKAVEGLQSRFGREDMLVEVYVRELLTLVLKKVLNKSENMSLCSLYDKLESQLRALDSLGVTSEKYAAMLFPLVESSMPEELLRAWQRTSTVSEDPTIGGAVPFNTKNRLNKLMAFLRSEVENEERITLATTGFGLTSKPSTRHKRVQLGKEDDVPTAAGLVNVKDVKPNNNECIFCERKHSSVECLKAKKMSLDEKRKIINDKRCCYYCLKLSHFARKCKMIVKCLVCEGRHMTLMCPKLPAHQTATETPKGEEATVAVKTDNVLASHLTTPEVLLQTLVVKVKGTKVERLARAIIDTGSQKSYIMEKTADEMGFEILGKQKLKHSLFGGVETLQQDHKLYRICVSSINEKYECKFDALNQELIVGEISHIKKGKWMKELQEADIKISDIGNVKGPIEILIGADIAGKLFTGRQRKLECGLVAIETHLGWTLLGKVPEETRVTCAATTAISMFIKNARICDLWELETLGIRDPVEVKSKLEKDLEVKQRFLETIQIKEDGRYEIKLPWMDDQLELPTNYEIAEKRLHSLTRKLRADGHFNDYDQVLKEWRDEGIIEEVITQNTEVGHYLPHRHVVKENSTTRLRPVFDASARAKNQPSLNDCLETGPNMIELIPAILLRFRMNKIGVIADIKRAFLQISVSEEERDFLKFLWWDENNKIKVYRHARVVFGVSSSPFLLAAVVDYHLNKTLSGLNGGDSSVTKETVYKLIRSFYVDNCVTSVNNHRELEQFMRESKGIMSSARFELRAWEYTSDKLGAQDELTAVLGLKWNKCADTLEVNTDFLKTVDINFITKRLILSVSHKLYDPIGFLCPITLYTKLLLQQTWADRLGWDTELDEEMKAKFTSWYQELSILSKIKIPRWLLGERSTEANLSVHTFCDASKVAYAAAVFMRVETSNGVCVQLIQAKSRIVPLKKMTIPRLELMAATVGVRVTTEVMKTLEFTERIPITYWTDSTTVLTWIKRNERWEVFVRNRIQEIHKLSKPEDWRHVAGENNPADLPSRGCSTRKLLELRWWEGPAWLKLNSNEWPKSCPFGNETEETKKLMTLAVTLKGDFSWYYRYFSNFQKIVRLVAWVIRFTNNCRTLEGDRIKTDLTVQEVENAKRWIVKSIQQEWFDNEKITNISSLNTFHDQEGIIRVKTKITLREDTENFRYPIVLPDQHKVVKLLVQDRHEKMNHAGVQILLNNLREDYWITRGRRAVRNVIKGCVVCKRYTLRNTETVPSVLPLDRVRDARVFEVVGIDYAGPLYIKGSIKVWICLFTCAVYRAIHLELVSSLSTTSFIQAMRRFVARRGRPTKIYSDNGTNFVGAGNLLASIDWKKIAEFGMIHKIEWKFNPPTAAWWGGWWERLIRMIKDLLKRVLGRSCVTYEEMITILYDCEAIINSRPITYMMDGDPSVSPLTPDMFLHELKQIGVPDLDRIDEESLNSRMRYLHKLRIDLRQRFRNEYLGFLVQKSGCNNSAKLKIGEIVLVGHDNCKRLDWPLGKIIELMPGKDGECRLVKLKTSSGELLRPVQRLYRLEICSMGDSGSVCDKLQDCQKYSESDSDNETIQDERLITRRGREIKLPKRYLD